MSTEFPKLPGLEMSGGFGDGKDGRFGWPDRDLVCLVIAHLPLFKKAGFNIRVRYDFKLEFWLSRSDPAALAEVMEIVEHRPEIDIDIDAEIERLKRVELLELYEDLLRTPHYVATAQMAKEAARATADEWGKFTTNHARVIELLGTDEILPDEIVELKKAVGQTKKRAEKRKAAPVKPSLVDLPDDAVVTAIRRLTRLDGDHAALRNDEGWSASDSAAGHWCHAMLTVDRDLAIAHARPILHRYMGKQLKDLAA
jgi:hypothetical protein